MIVASNLMMALQELEDLGIDWGDTDVPVFVMDAKGNIFPVVDISVHTPAEGAPAFIGLKVDSAIKILANDKSRKERRAKK